MKEALANNPEQVINKGQKNLERWAEKFGYLPGWVIEWQSILTGGVSAINRVLDSTDEHSTLLRSSSPFAGVLSNKERMRIIHEQERQDTHRSRG